MLASEWPELERYWNDPQFRAEVEAETVAQRARLNAWWDDIQAPARAKQAAAWEREAALSTPNLTTD